MGRSERQAGLVILVRAPQPVALAAISIRRAEMDKLTSILASLAALSLATERVTETIKGLPGLSRWLAVEKGSGTTAEEFRKASIHLVAIVLGTVLGWQAHLAATLGLPDHWWSCVLLGAM